MFTIREKQEGQKSKISGAEREASEKAELRRQMYERIAQGNALSETEDKAFQQWKQRQAL